MTHEKKVLACVDQSRFSGYVSDYAAWAARRLDAPLELLHILDRHPEVASRLDHSGAIGVNAQEQLLGALSSEDEIQSKTAREHGRIFLNQLRERVASLGMPAPDVRQRHGHLDETLAEQEDDVRLFVLGRRGESAEHTQRDLGRNVERVVRGLHKPILAVTEDFVEPKRVLIAFDGGMVTRRGVEMVAASPLFKGLPIYLLMSGKPTRDAQKQLEWAKTTLERSEFEVLSFLMPGDAESVIAKFIPDHKIDVLVMGAYSHSPWRSFVFGSKTSDLLRSARVPTLLLR